MFKTALTLISVLISSPVLAQTDFVTDGAVPSKCQYSAERKVSACIIDIESWANIPIDRTNIFYDEFGKRVATVYNFDQKYKRIVLDTLVTLFGQYEAKKDGYVWVRKEHLIIAKMDGDKFVVARK